MLCGRDSNIRFHKDRTDSDETAVRCRYLFHFRLLFASSPGEARSPCRGTGDPPVDVGRMPTPPFVLLPYVP